MQGWGYGFWGGGAFGVGNLVVGVSNLTTQGKQVSWKSDMVVTAGYRSVFDATYQVTVHTDCQSALGAGGLTISTNDVILLTGTPMLADIGSASLTITENSVEATSAPVILTGSTSLTTTVFAPSITTSVFAETGLGSVGSSNTFQPTLTIGNNLSLGSTSVAFTENTAFVNHGNNTTVGLQTVSITENAPVISTEVVTSPGVKALTTNTKQVTLSLDANIHVGFREILDTSHQVSLLIGNTVSLGVKTITISTQQPSLLIGNVLSLGATVDNQVATYEPIMLAGSFEPAGRTIAPLAQSRALIAIVESADGNDLVVKDVALEQSRSLIETPVSNGGNDILKVA